MLPLVSGAFFEINAIDSKSERDVLKYWEAGLCKFVGRNILLDMF